MKPLLIQLYPAQCYTHQMSTYFVLEMYAIYYRHLDAMATLQVGQ